LNYRTTLYETPSWRLSPSQRYCLWIRPLSPYICVSLLLLLSFRC
jgi:hypothetical protein